MAAPERDTETDSILFGADLTMIPGGIVSFTLTGSYAVEDTIIYGDVEEQQASVFDALDPLMSNLNSSYREIDVTRLGAKVDYPLSDAT